MRLEFCFILEYTHSFSAPRAEIIACILRTSKESSGYNFSIGNGLNGCLHHHRRVRRTNRP